MIRRTMTARTNTNFTKIHPEGEQRPRLRAFAFAFAFAFACPRSGHPTDWSPQMQAAQLQLQPVGD